LASSQMPTAVVQDMSKPSPVNFISAIGKQRGILESHSTFSLMQMTKDNTNHTVTAKKKQNKKTNDFIISKPRQSPDIMTRT